MKILVLGGSYFLGRVFTIICHKEHNLTLLNRGKFSMQEYGVTEHKLDRHNLDAIKALPKEDYDVIVDFCAYTPGDISSIFDNLQSTFKKYVFISTADVYSRGNGWLKTENYPLEEKKYQGEIGDYISGKVQLEKELIDCCAEKGISYGILRPSIIYGPYSYEQRESEYIRMIVKNQLIPFPYNAKGKFQMVYVKDVATAILEVAKQEGNSIYNVCPSEITDYTKFFDTLIKIASESGFDVKLHYKTVQQFFYKADFCPFPLTASETELYDGSKLEKELNISYTSLEEGMKKTFNAFKKVYS